MRIVAIGVGGAGCRIVDSLYSTDRKSSKVPCVQALAVDVDESTLKQLTAIPEISRLFFPAMDPVISGQERVARPTATIDIAEIISRLNNLESGETDAIVICLGLGGSMADIAPHIITGLRSSIVEPIFGLVTLPCLAEGEKRSAKAADDIDILSPLLDGMILFDNETWYKKTKALKATLSKKEKSLAHRLGLAKDEPELSPEIATYQLLNEGIVRRISLVLRAGEFKADGGIDLAEVVLDSGEVINTMKGMGFITIGYAVERLPSNPLAFLSQFRPQGVFDEENKKKASRIVDLAKQAIYHEISTPCDMTSAHKALILIAGPSHELSMKGFMTVRKWIDRSIAGLETRSGDYPILNTKNVAIIIMLSGLENIPRISELREIRAQYMAGFKKRMGGKVDLLEGSSSGESLTPESGSLRDEMIVLPTKMKKTIETPSISPAAVRSHTYESPVVKPMHDHDTAEHLQGDYDRGREHIRKKTVADRDYSEPSDAENKIVSTDATPSASSRHRVIVAEDTAVTRPQRGHVHTQKEPTPGIGHSRSAESLQSHNTSKDTGGSFTRLSAPVERDASRQRIELELQKQRIKAMAGRVKSAEGSLQQQPIIPEKETKLQAIHSKTVISRTSSSQPDSRGIHEPLQKTVIIRKRKLISHPQENETPENNSVDTQPEVQEIQRSSPVEADPHEEKRNDMTVAIKDTTLRAKDQVFEGREVLKPKTAVVKDESLLLTNLKPKKPADATRKEQPATESRDVAGSPDQKMKPSDKKGKKPDDISWI
jgi:tubulin-like protein CetZ